MHLEIISAFSTASAAGGTAAAALTGDSLQIRAGKGKINLICGWASANTNNLTTQIVWPSGHDTTRGYRAVVPGGPIASGNAGSLIMPLGVSTEVEAQETLSITNFAAAAAGDVDNVSVLVHYEDFPGITGRFISADELDRRWLKSTTIVSSVADAGGGIYNEEVITSDSDLLRANKDYALVGMTTSFPAHALTMLSPDNGNTRVGMPGMLRPEVTSQFFALLSRATQSKTVPVFNSGNKAQIKVGFVGDENVAARIITMHLVLLK